MNASTITIGPTALQFTQDLIAMHDLCAIAIIAQDFSYGGNAVTVDIVGGDLTQITVRETATANEVELVPA